jgi:hypothetical protein
MTTRLTYSRDDDNAPTRDARPLCSASLETLLDYDLWPRLRDAHGSFRGTLPLTERRSTIRHNSCHLFPFTYFLYHLSLDLQ